MGMQVLAHKLFDLWGGVERYNYLQLSYKKTPFALLRNLRKVQLRQVMRHHNCFIPVQNGLPESCTFPHGLDGIFLSQGVKIGKGCTIFHQVTIGSNTMSDSKGTGTPCVGNNVYIGAGAKIIGHVTIGDNVRIGANCVVVKDVPANATVVSAPMRMIEKTNPQNNIFVAYGSNGNP